MPRPSASRRSDLHRLQNVSTTPVECRGQAGTEEDNEKLRKQLELEPLSPEVARHQPFRKSAVVGFESLPPSQALPQGTPLPPTDERKFGAIPYRPMAPFSTLSGRSLRPPRI